MSIQQQCSIYAAGGGGSSVILVVGGGGSSVLLERGEGGEEVILEIPVLLPVINHRLYSHLAESKYGFKVLNITQRLLFALSSISSKL